MFGYNRSVAGVDAARADGFDATTDVTEVLHRAAGDRRADRARRADARVADHARSRPRHSHPHCPLTDVTSVKVAVLKQFEIAGLLRALRRRTPDDRHRPLGLGGGRRAGCSSVRPG